ncbi:glycosyltransferase [Sulfuricurvum sp.]|uniref:glycosyltransferase n=1 Tax=Sulfuricurvum sp. TaxID=2025608 RepID=UPI002628C560|nr:glycosyltransferase [Sulfuricurvum sp.]MDD4882928.1 glycosyltransferase [Sulfuricurvum sp.]
MRIVQILPALNEGGVERGTVDSNREYVRRGHDSIVISSGGKLADQIGKDGGTHIILDVASKNIFTLPIRVYRLWKLLKDIKPDIIHARSRVPAWLAYLANKTLHIPFITTVHGFNSVNAYSAVMTYGERVICASAFLIDHIRQYYKVPLDIIRLIPRGIDLEYFNASDLDSTWIKQFMEQNGLKDKTILVQIARVTGWKDQRTVIKAFLRARESNASLKLLIVGGIDKTRQEYFQELRKLVDDSPFSNDILFVGNQTHIKEIFSLSALNISASTKPETFGRANVEGMVMGIPLLSSKIGAAYDYVKEGKTGFFFEPGDYIHLSELIHKALVYPFDRESISSFAKSEFSLDQMIIKTLDAYREVLSN